MPTNLNALIRYKTINGCLHGGRHRWSIGALAGACTEALGESRGRYGPVAERTVRDDLRVMKSDILGFNAPIEQERGLYFYTDPHYSILSMKITDPELAVRILGFLMGLRAEIHHPELESILELLHKLTGKPYEIKGPAEEMIVNACLEKADNRLADAERSGTGLMADSYSKLREDRAEDAADNQNAMFSIKTIPPAEYPGGFFSGKSGLSWSDIIGKII
jgi:hypothetical protein